MHVYGMPCIPSERCGMSAGCSSDVCGVCFCSGYDMHEKSLSDETSFPIQGGFSHPE